MKRMFHNSCHQEVNNIQYLVLLLWVYGKERKVGREGREMGGRQEGGRKGRGRKEERLKGKRKTAPKK